MESATILTPLAPALAVFCQISVFLKDQNMKKINTISMHGEKFYKLQTETTASVGNLIIVLLIVKFIPVIASYFVWYFRKKVL